MPMLSDAEPPNMTRKSFAGLEGLEKGRPHPLLKEWAAGEAEYVFSQRFTKYHHI